MVIDDNWTHYGGLLRSNLKYNGLTLLLINDSWYISGIQWYIDHKFYIIW